MRLYISIHILYEPCAEQILQKGRSSSNYNEE